MEKAKPPSPELYVFSHNKSPPLPSFRTSPTGGAVGRQGWLKPHVKPATTIPPSEVRSIEVAVAFPRPIKAFCQTRLPALSTLKIRAANVFGEMFAELCTTNPPSGVCNA
jgi:hypothetical protein